MTPVNWEEVYERLCTVDPAALSLDEAELLAQAAFWLGKPKEALDARRQAYMRYKDAGDDEMSARAAWLLCTGHFDLSEIAVAVMSVSILARKTTD